MHGLVLVDVVVDQTLQPFAFLFLAAIDARFDISLLPGIELRQAGLGDNRAAVGHAVE